MAIVEALEPTAARRRLRVKSPVTLEPLREFEVCTADDVREAVARAREAQVAWGAQPIADRVAVMQKALALLVERQDHVIDVICAETGRSRMETTFMEVFPACDSLNFFSLNAKKMLRDRRVGMHLLRMKRARIAYQPLGVVGVISPWNGPFILSLNPAVQALLAGNAVIIKPSEVTPGSALLVAELLADAGLPDGVLQVLLGDGETGAALVDGGVDMVAFTGSVSVGRLVGEACGRNLIPCVLELGGKDPMIVCSDANLERAASGAVFGAFLNMGQFCCSVERCYVVDAVYDEFLAKVVAHTEALRLGTEGEFDLGPFIFERQLERVEAQIADAVANGAKVVCGGKRRPDLGEFFFEPTVIVDVPEDCALMHEETFGPVLPVLRCVDEEDAIRKANASPFGLSGSVWSRDKRRGEAIATRVDTGSVCVNDTGISYGALELPFGGRKLSGVGQVHGAEGLRRFAHAQPVITDRFGSDREQVWYPYVTKTLDGMQKAIRVLWGTPLRWLMR